MSNASDYLEAAIINHFFRQTAQTSPSALYLALYTTLVQESGAGTEVVGGSYARQPITFGAPVAELSTSSNVNQLTFSNMPACIVFAGAIVTASSGGQVLASANFTTARQVLAGQPYVVPIGEIVLTVR